MPTTGLKPLDGEHEPDIPDLHEIVFTRRIPPDLGDKDKPHERHICFHKRIAGLDVSRAPKRVPEFGEFLVCNLTHSYHPLDFHRGPGSGPGDDSVMLGRILSFLVQAENRRSDPGGDDEEDSDHEPEIDPVVHLIALLDIRDSSGYQGTEQVSSDIT